MGACHGDRAGAHEDRRVFQGCPGEKIATPIVFKGGAALKLFYDLPRYSEDIHYDFLPGVSPQKLMDIIKNLFTKRRWEITDEALKYYTLLFELRFAGPERNFRVKIEISTREKELKTAIMPLRGVPVLTFVDRQAGRDIFDARFILKNAYPLDKAMVEHGREGLW
ncbi:MAG: nucleotidyl transferase AbiEii/AbiGii toxin family protein [Desulfobacteraceae bacterium]|nr:nucleotidyl transferase AbiEii/AbiGii toxin family protein [Desulfobacteraceae bacterium]